MGADDLFLGLQRWIDRLIRRCQLGARPAPSRRRLLLVQIDGLGRAALEEAFARRRAPFLRRLLNRHGYRLTPMSVGLPSSTPAFQMAAMYGVQPDIPGFHYHDKRRGQDVHFPRAGHAALVEAEQAAGRRSIVRGGSVYGCVFTGGADNDLFSFARLTRPTGQGVLRVLSGFVVIAWVIAKSVALTFWEIGRTAVRIATRPRQAREHWQWLQLKVGLSVWVRQFFTLAAARDLYAGVPVIYLNFLDYDVAAHAFGPRSRRAFRALEHVDSSLRQLWRIQRRLAEHRYDMIVLADHGQAHCEPFAPLAAGRPLPRMVFEDLLGRGEERVEMVEARPDDYAHGFSAYGIGGDDLAGRLLRAWRPGRRSPDPEADAEGESRGGVRVIAAGPNAFVYLLDRPDPVPIEELELRWPGLAASLSASPGIGFVLARAADGPVCFWRGKRLQLSATERGPFADRADWEILRRDLAGLMAMRCAGDLVIYGTGTSDGRGISYIPEVGAHAGPSPEEMQTFVMALPSMGLPPAITHPLELYPLLSRYQDEVDAAGRPG